MVLAHNLGFPRLGANREMKRAVEAYWRGEIDRGTLAEKGAELRRRNWAWQAAAGLDLVPVGDFSWYDHVLDLSVTLGAIPERFAASPDQADLDTLFRMARGCAPSGADVRACEMTKWFDTNYHYLVPELSPGQSFGIFSERLFDEIAEALAQGHRVKPVMIGPLTYLWLAKAAGEPFDKLTLLDDLLVAYAQMFQRISSLSVEWVQVDEPILALDLPQAWRRAFQSAYERLAGTGVKVLLAVYFGGLGDNFACVQALPVAGLHLDGVLGGAELERVAARLKPETVLSAGIVDGRNVWRNPLRKSLDRLTEVRRAHPALWVAPSCSLQHTPVDLDSETGLDAEARSWLAFARQKTVEVGVLARALRGERDDEVQRAIAEADRAAQSRAASTRTYNSKLREKVVALTAAEQRRKTPYERRASVQKERLKLPLFPTTTIGSFPQTPKIRMTRRDFKKGVIDERDYREKMRAEIADVIGRQENMGLDVLVHGEPERNDMVEYFGELLDGFLLTTNGWVQSYGSRCTKPPIIFGEITRPRAMTVEWSNYAQSLTEKPVKGMLTGAVTILRWSFPRDDVSQAESIYQIALALREEVAELERSGIKIIQVDEPALREGLPLRRADRQAYLDCAVRSFHITTGAVADDTQIHTHMCYSEFNDIIETLIALDSDVISIEASRSNMELLDAFENLDYPNDIGPGVYDIHSPRVPTTDAMMAALTAAGEKIPQRRLWVNPDCGLKTRGWEETTAALTHMVEAARRLRGEA